jgi:hypothetical protein
MCPGNTLYASRGGFGSYAGRTFTPFNRAYGSHHNRAYGAGPPATSSHTRFVVLDTDEETGATTIETSPGEQVTITGNDVGSVTIVIAPVPVADDAPAE